MTIEISSSRASSLSAIGTENNPIIGHYNVSNLSGTAYVSNPTATADGAASNAFDGRTSTFWVPDTTGVTNCSLEVTLASAQILSFAAIASHNLSDYGADVKVQYSTDGGSVWNTIGAAVTPTDNGAIAWYFEYQSAADWRIRVTGFTAGDPIAIGVVMMTNPLTFGSRIYQGFTPPIASNDVTLLNNVSVGGHLLGNSTVKRGLMIDFPIDLLDTTFVRGIAFQGFVEAFNTGKGFFFAWRPTQFGDVRYCWREGGTIAPSNSVVNLMAAPMKMRAFGD